MRGPKRLVIDGEVYDVWESEKAFTEPLVLKFELTEEDLMEKLPYEPPMITDAKSAVMHLKDGDILVLRVDDDIPPSSMDVLATQLRRLIKETGRTHVGLAILRPGMDLDIVHGDKTVGQLRAEIEELKATVAKYLTK